MLIQSKSIQIVKYVIIAPLLVNSLMSFTPKKAHNSEYSANSILKNSESEVTAIITKTATDSQLEALVDMYASQNVTLKFKNVKRNASKEIIAISISAQSKDSNLKYKVDSSEPILPIKISLNLGSNNLQLEKFEGDKHTYIVKTNNASDSETTKIMIKSVNSNTESVVELDKDNKLISLTTDGETTELDKKGDAIAWITETKYIDASQNPNTNENISSVLHSDKKSPIIFVNGKKISETDLDKIDPNTIEKMNVWKGKKAIEKYGEVAKDGAIEVTLKKS